MIVGKALKDAADLATHISQLTARARDNSHHQEGDQPLEDPNQLLREAVEAVEQLQLLRARINHANLRLTLPDGSTLTDALARRDALKKLHKIHTELADAASGKGIFGFARQRATEIKMVTAVDVAALRGRADQYARQLRELDDQIQQVNWSQELTE